MYVDHSVLRACRGDGRVEQETVEAHWAPRVRCPIRIARTGWTEMTDGAMGALADRLVGDSGDMLDQVRIRQHQLVGTPRELLLVDVAQSLTKMCDVWAPGDRPVVEVFEALYVK